MQILSIAWTPMTPKRRTGKIRRSKAKGRRYHDRRRTEERRTERKVETFANEVVQVHGRHWLSAGRVLRYALDVRVCWQEQPIAVIIASQLDVEEI